MGLNQRSRSAGATFGGTFAGFALQKNPSPQAASNVHSWPALGPPLQVPGAKPARPRRSIVFRSDAPNCEKSQVRPSWPPKSAWQAVQVTYEASCAVLVTAPGVLLMSGAVARLKSGAASSRPTLFGTLESRAAVLKRFFPSRSAGGSASAAMPPVRLDTGAPRMSGTQSAVVMHGPFVPQSASIVHGAPPGWLQNPPPPPQSFVVPQVCAKLSVQRKFAGRPSPSSGVAAATGTTFRER